MVTVGTHRAAGAPVPELVAGHEVGHQFLEGLFLAPGDVDQVVLAITLDREDVPVGILEPGDLAAAGAR